MISLQNEILKIGVKNIGAELCEISSIKNGTQYLWNADPDIWPHYAPNLFPIVGMLKEETYYFEGKAYQLPKHGFIRNNPNFKITEKTDKRVVLSLTENAETLNVYPFKFKYEVIYELKKHQLSVSYKVINRDTQPVYFSLGAHPAFKCPVFEDEVYEDYRIVFESDETSKTHLLDMETGLVTSNTKPIFDTSNSINLKHSLFEQDALILKDLKSRKVTLKSNKHGPIVTLHYDGFPYVGIWAKPNGDYVCLEPWMGIADSENSNQQLVDKEGIIKLTRGKTFEATYKIEIHTSHLV